MNYAKVQNGAVEVYPYSFNQLKKDNKSTSFPRDFFQREDEFSNFNVVKIIVSDKPSKEGWVPVEETPSFANGTWSQNWKLVPKDTSDGRSEAEEAAWTAGAFDRAIASLREDRNRRLFETDWYALQDVTLTEDMRDYRQALRDLPEG